MNGRWTLLVAVAVIGLLRRAAAVAGSESPLNVEGDCYWNNYLAQADMGLAKKKDSREEAGAAFVQLRSGSRAALRGYDCDGQPDVDRCAMAAVFGSDRCTWCERRGVGHCAKCDTAEAKVLEGYECSPGPKVCKSPPPKPPKGRPEGQPTADTPRVPTCVHAPCEAEKYPVPKFENDPDPAIKREQPEWTLTQFCERLAGQLKGFASRFRSAKDPALFFQGECLNILGDWCGDQCLRLSELYEAASKPGLEEMAGREGNAGEEDLPWNRVGADGMPLTDNEMKDKLPPKKNRFAYALDVKDCRKCLTLHDCYPTCLALGTCADTYWNMLD